MLIAQLWSESPQNSQSRNYISTDSQCLFKIYRRWIKMLRGSGRKEKSN
jgi:hypothetical protein